jgi:hypothetical protein
LRPAQVERDDDAPSRGELVEPAGREVPHADGRDHPVVRRARRKALVPVGAQHAHSAASRHVEVVTGAGHQVGVDVDADHLAVRTREGGEQRGVVAGARADLQYPVAGPYVELVEHDGHDRRLGRGADRRAALIAFGDDRRVLVGLLHRDPGQEGVPWDREQRLSHGPADLALPEHLVE